MGSFVEQIQRRNAKLGARRKAGGRHWAAPFAAAVRRNGGRLIASERIGVEDLIDALDAAEAAAN